MIQYRKQDGTLGEVDDSRGSCSIEVKDHSFTIVREIYGWDEYDFWYDNIEDVIEVRIG